jgi:hypothetical protein
MSNKAAILAQAAGRHKRPWDLTGEEVCQLMRAFTAGKTCILEDDALILVRWAQRQRAGALALAGVLAGHLRPLVDGDQVTVEVLPAPLAAWKEEDTR